MSLGVILFLLYHLPEQRRWILPLALAFEAYTVFEIMYLGTHTPTDVVVGFTFAVAAFCLYRVAQHRPVQPVAAAVAAVPEVQLALAGALAWALYQLEGLEDQYDKAATHPREWEDNYTSYCSLEPGTAAAHMRHSTAWSKSALAVGLALAWYLRRRLALDTGDGVAPLWARVARTAAGLVAFSTSKAWVRALAASAMPAATSSAAAFVVKHLHYAAQPLVLLVAAPAVAQVVRLGRYVAPRRSRPAAAKVKAT